MYNTQQSKMQCILVPVILQSSADEGDYIAQYQNDFQIPIIDKCYLCINDCQPQYNDIRPLQNYSIHSEVHPLCLIQSSYTPPNNSLVMSTAMDHSPNISLEFDQISLAQFCHCGGIINTKDITESINRQQICQINCEPSYQQFAEAQRASRHIPLPNNSLEEHNQYPVELHEEIKEEKRFDEVLELQREEYLRSQIPLTSSKDEMYSLLLKPYRYSKLQISCRNSRKSRTVYSCGYEGCGKLFNKGWSILDHVRMHEGVKPFKCEHCDMAFTQKSNLIKHTRRHLVQKLKDRKRYKCSLCPKGFTERYNLKAHMQKHL